VPAHLSLVSNEPATTRGAAWLARGFRPFFLGAGAHAALAVPAWVAVWLGAPWLKLQVNPLDWHAHEMVFGFAGAVMAGFLLTAVTNWTERTTLEGGGLAALFLAWLGGRIAPFVPEPSGLLPVAFDFAFWSGLALGCLRPIVASRNRRNYGFIVLLSGLLLAAMLSHANMRGLFPAGLGLGRKLGIDLIVLAILVVSSRVVPMFTRNATGATDISSAPALERAAIGGMLLLTILDVANVVGEAQAALSVLVGVLALLRARKWGAKYTLGKPLLWTLHLGVAWIGLGLILAGLAAFVPRFPPSVALHAITAGGIGLLCLGMMTRVSLGHTGRMLAIGPSMVWAMRALAVAVLLRVVGPLLFPLQAPLLLFGAALLWCAAFGLYLVNHAKALVTPRADGRPG